MGSLAPHYGILLSTAALFIGLALASVVFLTTMLLVVALTLRSRWQHMGDREETSKKR